MYMTYPWKPLSNTIVLFKLHLDYIFNKISFSLIFDILLVLNFNGIIIRALPIWASEFRKFAAVSTRVKNEGHKR